MTKLLDELSINTSLFNRQTVCTNCGCDLLESQIDLCSCGSLDEKHRAVVYDIDANLVLTATIKRVSPDIENVKKMSRDSHFSMNNRDTIFGELYKQISRRFANESIVSLIFHLDGMFFLEFILIK